MRARIQIAAAESQRVIDDLAIARAQRLVERLDKAGFDDDQPRDEHGKWTSGGSFSSGGVKLVPTVGDTAKNSDPTYRAQRAAFHAQKATTILKKAAAEKDPKKRDELIKEAGKSIAHLEKHAKAAQKLAKTDEEKAKAKAALAMAAYVRAREKEAKIGAKPAKFLAKLEEKEKEKEIAKPKDTPATQAKLDVGKTMLKASQIDLTRAAVDKDKDTIESGIKSAKSAMEKADEVMKMTASPDKSSQHYKDAQALKSEAMKAHAQLKAIESQQAAKKADEPSQELGPSTHQGMSSAGHSVARQEFTKQLTPKEKSAVLAYSGSYYGTINTALRQEKDLTSVNGPSGFANAKEAAEHIDAALAKAPAEKDLLVYRGMSGGPPGGFTVGATYTDHGYMSTSVAKSSAFGGSVFMEIEVPKGHPAAPIPSHFEHEREILLPRGQTIEIVAVTQKAGKTHVRARVRMS